MYPADLFTNELQLVLRESRSLDPSNRSSKAGRGVVAVARAVEVRAADVRSAGSSLAELGPPAD
jgi:hypothetical protein